MVVSKIVLHMDDGHTYNFKEKSADEIIEMLKKNATTLKNPLIINDDSGKTTNIIYTNHISHIAIEYQ